MRFGRADALAYAPESNDDDIRDNRDDPKKRDNRPGIKNPWDPPMVIITQIPASVCSADPQRGSEFVGARRPGDSRDRSADDQWRTGPGVRGGGGDERGGQGGAE